MQPITQNGRTAIVLRDPIGISDKTLVVPQQVAPLLVLCDGTRDANGLRAALAVRYGTALTPDTVERALTALDDALFLYNERFAQAYAEALEQYRAAPFRPARLANESYPAEANDLRRFLDNSFAATPNDRIPSITTGRGLVSPHIDYGRGTPVYAAVWEQATEMVRQADLVILAGTDHHGGEGKFTLTRQHYATPFGVLPTDQDTVEELAQAIGPENAFADELHHRVEHSIELAAVWLHYVREEQPCEIVPILCGSFAHYVRGDADPIQDLTLQALVQTLRKRMAGRRTLVVAAADLSHIGPAFGGQSVDLAGRAQLQEHDNRMIERICAGDAAGFFAHMRATGDRYNVCGLPPIDLTLRLLENARGTQIAYDRCPADGQSTSWVSICGIIFE